MRQYRKFTILAAVAIQFFAAFPAGAQTVPAQQTDDTVLKQFIIFGRHGVRSAAEPASVIAPFAVRPYPDFGVPAGYLTPHGSQAEALLGNYFRAYLQEQHLLTGNDSVDAGRSYFRANSIQRSNVSAEVLASALFPANPPPVHSYPLGTTDPLFDPIAANVAQVDTTCAQQEVSGVFGTSGTAVSSAYSAEFSLIRSVLFNYPLGTQPAPATPPGLIDATAIPIPLTANTTGLSTGGVINANGVQYTLLAADPFVMEYTDGLPLSDVGWGQLSLDQLSQQTRIITLDFALETSPYLNKVQSSNAAAHILASIQQEIFGQTIPGAFSPPGTRVIVINSSDLYVVGLAGLLNMHWQLPGYQPDYAAPGGSLVFELRQSRSTGEYIVRVYYTAQTFDQLRNLTPLTLDQPPATQQLLIPGIGSNSLDVDAFKFSDFLLNTIDFNNVQNPITETPPGPLTGVPLQ